MSFFHAYKLLIPVVCLIAGCTASQGFDRGRLEASLAPDKLEVSDEEIAKMLKLKPQISFPFRLGIYLKDYDYRWSRLE